LSKFKISKLSRAFGKIVNLLTIVLVSLYVLFCGWFYFFEDQFTSFFALHWYPRVRSLGSTLVNVVPFPIIYFLVGLIVLWLISLIINLLKRNWWKSLVSLLIGISILFTSFYVCWGFNYRLPTFVQRLSLKVNDPQADWIQSQIKSQAVILDSIRSTLTIPSKIDYKHLHANVEEAINQYLVELNQTQPLSLPYVIHDNIKIQPLGGGTLLRLETSGVYLSQTFQGHVDSGLSHIQIPNTLMHEMLHGYGITEESDCNLIAYLAGSQSDDPWIRYSAGVAWFRYLAFDWIAQDREGYFAWRSQLSPLLIADLDDINKHLRAYPALLGPVKDKIYGAYLRSNGISDGVANYSYFVKVIYSLEEGRNRD